MSVYGFMLTACNNGEPSINDTFRIKIWDEVGDTIYDNVIDAGDDTYLGDIIFEGNIQIHQSAEHGGKKSQKSNLRA